MSAKHKHFEIAPGVMVKGDPDMSRATKDALIKMAELVTKVFRERLENGSLDPRKHFGTENPKSAKAGIQKRRFSKKVSI